MTVQAIDQRNPGFLSRIAVQDVAAVALAALSLAIFAVSIRHGIGVMVDSTRYFGVSPKPYDAPAYPFLLHGLAATGLSLEDAATLIAAVLAPLNTLLVWTILFRATGRILPAVLGTLVVALYPPYAAYHAMAMSEPPFIALLLLTVILAAGYRRGGGRTWLVAAAVALGLASLVRFTAPPLGAAIALALLLDGRGTPTRRVADVALFGAVSAAIFLGWVGYSLATTGHGTGRPMEWLGNLDAQRWMITLDAFTSLLLPTAVPLAVRVAALAVVVAASAAAVIRAVAARPDVEERDVAARFVVLSLSVFTVLYVGFLFLATLIEANLTINGRYLLPGAVTGVLAVTIATARLPAGPAVRGFAIVAMLVVAGHAIRTADAAADAFREGLGFNALRWTRSPTLAEIERLPADALFASNGPDAIAYRTGRDVRFAPSRFDRRTGLVRPGNAYGDQVADIRRQAAVRPTYVVYFDRVDWRFYLAPEPEVVAALALRLVASTDDGRIYAVPGAASRSSLSDPPRLQVDR